MTKKFGICFFIAILLVSCGGNGNENPTPAPYTEFEYDVKQTGTDVLQFAGQPFPITADNCGGLESSSQTTTRSQKFTTELNVEVSSSLTTEFGGDIKVVKAILGTEIATKLGVTLGVESQATSSLEITTPPGTKTTALLQWKAQWTKGDISIIRPDGTYIDILPFAVLNSLNLEQQEIETVDCETGEVLSKSLLGETLPTEILISGEVENPNDTMSNVSLDESNNQDIKNDEAEVFVNEQDDPYLYDNFNETTTTNSFSGTLWQYWDDSSQSEFSQKDGLLTFNGTSSNALVARRHIDLPIKSPTFYEAHLMLKEVDAGSVTFKLHGQFSNGNWWTTQCGVSASENDGSIPWAFCDYSYKGAPPNYTRGLNTKLGVWHTIRIEVDPNNQTVTHFIDNESQGSIVVDDINELEFSLVLETFSHSNGKILAFFDEVRYGTQE